MEKGWQLTRVSSLSPGAQPKAIIINNDVARYIGGVEIIKLTAEQRPSNKMVVLPQQCRRYP